MSSEGMKQYTGLVIVVLLLQQILLQEKYQL